MIRPHGVIERRYQTADAKAGYLQRLFDEGAPYYDRLGRIGSFGTGHAYRRRALRRGGVRPGLRILDVACGTGAVTRAITDILQGDGEVIGIDPSEGMLQQARASSQAEFRSGHAEDLPFPNDTFDFLTMGYALRHVQDLGSAVAEFRRVLRPGGRVLVLEITKPAGRMAFWMARLYFRDLLPFVASVVTRSGPAREMMDYYWETIDACVPPQEILAAMNGAGFEKVDRHVEGGIFSEYRASKPGLTDPPL